MTADLADLLAQRPLPPITGGKESKGDVVIVGGAETCPGAALLAGRSALRCGAGRVQLVVHPAVAPAVGTALPEAFVMAWAHGDEDPSDAVSERLSLAAAVVVGPGLGAEAPGAALRVSKVLDGGVLVLDAQAIPALSDPALGAAGARLAAPNPDEASRLLDEPCDDDADLGPLAKRLAEVVGGPAGIRGATTMLDDGSGQQWVESSSNPGLGTPGSGDVLMGALGAFLGRGADPLTALGWAVAAHARSGALLAEDRPVGFLASDVCDSLPLALRSLGA